MNKIHVSRNRQSLGHFFPAEVAVGLRTGRFFPTDLGWQDPMETWKPLAEFEDLPRDEPAEPPALPEHLPVIEAGPNEPAWEQVGTASPVSLFFKTIGQVFAQPLTTFRGLAPDAPMGRALWYYLILATLASWVFLGYGLAVALLFPEMVKPPSGVKITPSMLIQSQIFTMLFAPFFLAGVALAFSGFLHLLLTLFGVPQPVFALTVRVFCYAVGTSFLMLLIPICGLFFFVPCAVIFAVLGLKEAHRTDAFRPLVAVMIPVMVLCFGYVLLLLQAGLIR